MGGGSKGPPPPRNNPKGEIVKKKLLVIVGALIAAQVLSGCYFLREINWSKDLVPKNKSTKATIGLQSTDATEDSHFFLGMQGKGAGFSLKKPVFDSRDDANLKQKMVEDLSLGELIGSECDLFSPTGARGPSTGGIWRTDEEVKSVKAEKMLQVKVKAKRLSNDSGGFAGIVVTGFWRDDGDGVAEDPGSSDDEFGCTGEATTSFLMKGNSG